MPTPTEIKLSKPITYEDIEYTVLRLDLDGLTGNDLLKAEKEFVLAGGRANVPELSKGYLSIVAAKASKVPTELIHALPARDFSRVTLAAQDFLFGME